MAIITPPTAEQLGPEAVEAIARARSIEERLFDRVNSALADKALVTTDDIDAVVAACLDEMSGVAETVVVTDNDASADVAIIVGMAESLRAESETALRELVASHLKTPVLDAAGLQYTAIMDLVHATRKPCVIELPLGTYTAAVERAAKAADTQARELGYTVRLKPSEATRHAWALHVVAAKPST